MAVNFTDLSSGGNIVKRTWDFGDGQSPVSYTSGYGSGLSGPGRNYITANTYTITLTVQFDDNSILSQTHNINVYPKPLANFSASTLAGCKPLIVNFTDNSTTAGGAITNWFWNFGSGIPSTSTTQNQSNVVFSSNGSYDVVLYVVNSFGCKSDPVAKQTVQVYDRAVPSFTVDNTVGCMAPFTATFTNTTTGTGPISYNWDFGDGNTSTAVSPVNSYAANGTYNVSLTASNGTNCTNTARNYKVITVGSPGITAINGPDQLCAGSSASFSTTSDIAGASIKWTSSDGATYTGGVSYSRSFSAPGTYTITAQGISNGSCSGNVQTKTIVVNASPIIPAFTITPSSLCKDPFTVQFTNKSTGGANLDFKWSYGDGNVALNPSYPSHTYTYAAEGTKTVQVTVTDKTTGCLASSNTASVDIRKPQITINSIMPADLCQPPVTVTAQAVVTNLNDAIQQYTWDFNDGPASVTANATNSSINSASYSYSTSGNKTITVTATTTSGCSAVFTKAVTINDNCTITTGTVGGGFNSYYGNGSGNCQNKTTFTFTDPFSAIAANNCKVISWDFGDETAVNTDPVANPIQHTYNVTASQTFIITLLRQYVDAQGKTRMEQVQQPVDVVMETANFTVNKTNTCTQTSISFTPQNVNSAYVQQYKWDFGDGTTNTRSNSSYSPTFNGGTTHQYALPGSYNVTLTITDKLNCLSVYVFPQSINIKGPTANFSITDLTSCKQANFTKPVTDLSIATPGAPIVKWDWYIGSPLPGSPSVVYDAANPMPAIADLPFVNTTNAYKEYNVKLVVTDAGGCVSSSHTLSSGSSSSSQLVKSYWPVANFNSNNTLQCNNYNVLFNNMSTGSNLNYLWGYGDGQTSTINTSHTHNYAAAGDGTYTIALAVSEAAMPTCSDTKTLSNYIVITKPIADFQIGDASACAPVAVNFTNKSQYADTYSWDFGDNTTVSADKDPQGHIYAAGGDYNVTLSITGLNGCKATTVIPAKVKGPSGQMSYNKNVGCVPFDYSATITGKNIAGLAWDFRDGSLIGTGFADPSQTLTHTYVTPGKYLPNVIMASADGCSLKLEMDKQLIADDVKANLAIDKTAFCGSGTPVLTNGSFAPAFSSITNYLWTFGDGSTSTDAIPTAHAYAASGIYDIALQVTSQYGQCTSTAGPVTVAVHSVPTATIAGDDVVCLSPAKQPAINYIANIQSDDAIKTYEWQIDGNIVGTDKDLSIDYRLAGSHKLLYTINTINDCSFSIAKDIIIDSVVAAFDVLNTAACINNNVIQFKNNSTGASSIIYAWDFGDVATSVSQDPTHAYSVANEYDVQLIATTVNGCSDKLLKKAALRIYDEPTVALNNVSAICQNDSPEFIATVSSDDEITGYSWFVNDVILPDESNNLLKYQFTNTRSNSVKVSVQTKSGCRNVAQMAFVVNPLPASKTIADSTICKGSIIQLYASDGVKYHWYSVSPDFDGGESSSPLVSIEPLADTRFYVAITNQYGCSQLDSVNVITNNPPVLTVSDSIAICRGSSAQLFAKSTGNKYDWSPAEGLSRIDIADPIASPQQSIVYTVTVFSDNVCNNESKQVSVTVLDKPSLQRQPDLTLQAGQLVTLQPLTDNSVAYYWQPQQGLSCYDCKNPELKADKNITYRLTVSSADGCDTTGEINVKVLCGNGAVAMPNVFTPNGDGNNDVFYVMGWGIQLVKSFRVYDRWGKLVFIKENVQANDKSSGWNGKVNGVDVPQTSTFVYIADVICNEGKLIQLKGTVVLLK